MNVEDLPACEQVVADLIDKAMGIERFFYTRCHHGRPAFVCEGEVSTITITLFCDHILFEHALPLPDDDFAIFSKRKVELIAPSFVNEFNRAVDDVIDGTDLAKFARKLGFTV